MAKVPILSAGGSPYIIGGVPTLADQDDFRDCCCPPPPGGYILSQCDIDCPSSDCDGSESDLHTKPEKSPTLLPSDIGKVVKIQGSTECWEVSYTALETGTDVVVIANRATDVYTDCDECCDPCYICGPSCEFHKDSLVTFTYRQWICEYISGELRGIVGYTITNASDLPRTTDCKWGGTVTKKNYFVSAPAPADPIASCDMPGEGYVTSTTTPTLSIRYNCTTEVWEWSVGSWISTGISVCAGGSENIDSGSSASYITHKETTITLTNNSPCDHDGALG